MESKNQVYIFETWEDYQNLYFIHRLIFKQFFRKFQTSKYIEMSNEQLAEQFNISINQVARALKRLEEKDFIWRKPVLIINEDGYVVAKSRKIFLSNRRDWSMLSGGGSSG